MFYFRDFRMFQVLSPPATQNSLEPQNFDRGGAWVRLVEDRRHIGASLLPQSKVSYVQKGQGGWG